MMLLAGSTLAVSLRSPQTPRLRMAGIAQNPCNPTQVFAVPVGTAGSYYADTSVLHAPGGVYLAPGRIKPLTSTISSCLRTIVQDEQHWVRSGFVPGADQQQRAIATRALLDLYLSVRPNGAVIAGWSPGWDYAWPRDSSWVATALADTGHPAEAFKIMTFLERVQPGSGIWAARYSPDSGEPVRDGRPVELDADGWVPWAVWSWLVAARQAGDRLVRQELTQLWPMVVAAADAAARSLTEDGLPITGKILFRSLSARPLLCWSGYGQRQISHVSKVTTPRRVYGPVRPLACRPGFRPASASTASRGWPLITRA